MRSIRGKICLKLLLALSTVLLLAACGNTASTGGQAANASKENSAAAESNASAESKQESTEASGQTSQAAPETGYVFAYKDVVMEVDADIAPVIEALGEPKGYFEAPSCAFDGLKDKVYTYNDFELDTYPTEEGLDRISAIVFRSDIVTTEEGIAVGAGAAEIQKAYGEKTEADGMLTYEKGGMQLCFIMKDGKAASIEYRSTVLN